LLRGLPEAVFRDSSKHRQTGRRLLCGTALPFTAVAINVCFEKPGEFEENVSYLV
jgi:hypothetical protein